MGIKDKYAVIPVCIGIAFFLIMVIDFSGGFNIPEDHKGGWFFEYQTFLSGVFASIIAAISIYVAWYKYREDHKRKLFAARAMLPTALNDIHEYGEKCFKAVRDDSEDDKPIRNQKAMDIIHICIEYVNPKTAETLFDLLIYHQVHDARLNGYFTDNSAINSKSQQLHTSLLLVYKADQLFSFARNEVHECIIKNPDFSDICSTFRSITSTWYDQIQFNEYSDIYSGFFEYIENMCPEYSSSRA